MNEIEFDSQKFGQGVRYFRTKNSLKQYQLAEMVDISPQHLINLETGNANPSAAAVINICNALNVGINDCMADDHDSGKLLYRQFRSQIAYLNEREKIFLRDAIQNLMRL